MIFGIDFDGTYAAAPDLWRDFVLKVQSQGHTCVLVTGRSDDSPWSPWGREVRDMVGDLMPIVFAGSKYKRDVALAAGYTVDVWVDDNPEYIGSEAILKERQRCIDMIEAKYHVFRKDNEPCCGSVGDFFSDLMIAFYTTNPEKH